MSHDNTSGAGPTRANPFARYAVVVGYVCFAGALAEVLGYQWAQPTRVLWLSIAPLALALAALVLLERRRMIVSLVGLPRPRRLCAVLAVGDHALPAHTRHHGIRQRALAGARCAGRRSRRGERAGTHSAVVRDRIRGWAACILGGGPRQPHDGSPRRARSGHGRGHGRHHARHLDHGRPRRLGPSGTRPCRGHRCIGRA